MSLPPLNPEKTAAGIVIDPRTLERIVPSSKRSDGTVRKELKIRPGFTPQEDVGRFRTTRQQASDMAKGVIPGSGRPARPRAPDPNNPFAQPVAVPAAAKSKAQLKNEKRREKKRAGAAVVDKAWDESDDDDVDAGGDGMQEAFDEADRKHREETAAEAEAEAGPPVASEEGFAGLDGGLKDAGGGAPEEGVGEAVVGGGKLEEMRSPGDEFIESPPPHTPDTAEAASPSVPAPPASTSASAKAKADPAWRTRAPRAGAGGATSQSGATAAAGKPGPAATGSNGKASPRPHPIQGGRQGPIGLAHPPPASQPQSRNITSKGKSQAGKGAATKPGAGPTGTNSGATKASEEPRMRKEVRVREGGANDVSSLAARVRNMVIANQTPPRERKAKDAVPKAEGGA